VDTGDKVIIAGATLIAGYFIYKSISKNIFGADEPITVEGVSNIALRQNATINRYQNLPDRQFITVGNTTYSIKDSDVTNENLKYIRRRASLGNLTGLDNFDWFNKWVYS